MNKKPKKPFYKRWWFILIVALIIISSIGSRGDKNKLDEPTIADKEKVENALEFKGDMEVQVEDNKLIVTINSNAADGGIFEIAVMNDNLGIVSDFVPIEEGKIVKEFTVPDDWDIGYLAGTAMFRFNLDEHQQPDNIKGIYGENGEKMTGEQAEENELDGKIFKTGMIEPVSIAYPDEETVKEKQDELFKNAMQELIDTSNGVIVGIKPHIEGQGWESTRVIISDAWYNSPEHEKERFAEQIGELVQNIIINTRQVEPNQSVLVHFYDTYDKELASPKVLGGYKIKR